MFKKPDARTTAAVTVVLLAACAWFLQTGYGELVEELRGIGTMVTTHTALPAHAVEGVRHEYLTNQIEELKTDFRVFESCYREDQAEQRDSMRDILEVIRTLPKQ